MQPVYSTSNPVHHDQHSSPAQYVTVAPTSGKPYIIPGTEPRAMPGIYKQEYMQPVYITSYPVHHDQHASPAQYVTVAPTSGHHHAPALSGHGYTAAPAVNHGHTVAPVVGHDNTAAYVSHGYNV